MSRAKRLWAAFQATRAWQAWKRYGNVLAGGVGSFAFFSIFPAVALACTVFGFVLHGHPGLLSTVTSYLDTTLPGFIKDSSNPHGVIPVTVPAKDTLTLTGAISVVALVLSGVVVATRALVQGAMIGGVGYTLMQTFAGKVIGQATSNPLFASVVVVVGPLFWLKLLSRLVLLSAAWAANDVEAGARGHSPAAGGAAQPDDPVAATSPGGSAADAYPPAGSAAQPAGSRGNGAVLAAGALIGIAGTFAARAAGQGSAGRSRRYAASAC